MKTMELLIKKLERIPIMTGWYLSAIDEFKGNQATWNEQSGEKLRHLQEKGLIESSISSTRLEGGRVARSRLATMVLGSSPLKEHNEEEMRNYQKALRWIRENFNKVDINKDTILLLHRMVLGNTKDAAKWKETQCDISVRQSDGRYTTLFSPPDPEESLQLLEKAIELWHEQLNKKRIPPLMLLAAFNFDFLCIHPFKNGNGRVSRLLLLLQLYKLGYEVGQYISIEKIIAENRERYYESMQQSSTNWLEGKHDIWPFTNYILFVLKEAYSQLEVHLDKLPSKSESKTYLIRNFINSYMGQFSLSKIKYYLPGVDMEYIKKVLKDLQKEGTIRLMGRGLNAKWIKKGG